MEPEEAAAMTAMTVRLRQRFPDTPAEEIDRAVSVVHARYDGRPIRHFVPILVEREVVDVLRAATTTAPGIVVPRQRVGDPRPPAPA
jgi:hypothetical protein